MQIRPPGHRAPLARVNEPHAHHARHPRRAPAACERRARGAAAATPMTVTLAQVSVSRPREVRWRGQTISTGIFKEPVEGPVGVGGVNVDGDRQADLTVHGGWQKAVYAYTTDAYEAWRRERPDLDLPYGAFGENLTVSGLAEDEVCVGDRFRIGSVELVATEPRLPCFKLGIRLGSQQVVEDFLRRGRFGFYLSIAAPGELAAGDEVVRLARHPARFPVGRIARLYRDRADPDRMREALEIAAVPESWRAWFADELARTERRTGARLLPAAAAPAWAGYRPLVVRDKVSETDDVVSVHLTDPDGAALPAYRPGQHLTVDLPAGDGGASVIRSYSLSDAWRADAYRLTVKRIGVASSFVHDRLAPGDEVLAQAPGGMFSLDASEHHRPVVLVGAGIGLTPLIAMLGAIAAHERPRETWVFCGVRERRDLLMADRLEAIASADENVHLHVAESRGADGGGPPRRITAALLRSVLPASYYDYYLCGPGAFMQDLYDGLLAWGVPEHRVHFEAFGPAGVRRAGAEPAGVPGSTVTFSRSGVEATWNEPDEPLLDLAERAGASIPFGCRAGSCGTCATRVIAGEAGYMHPPAAPVAPDEILPCVAAPGGDLVLDA